MDALAQRDNICQMIREGLRASMAHVLQVSGRAEASMPRTAAPHGLGCAACWSSCAAVLRAKTASSASRCRPLPVRERVVVFPASRPLMRSNKGHCGSV